MTGRVAALSCLLAAAVAAPAHSQDFDPNELATFSIIARDPANWWRNGWGLQTRQA